MQALAKDASASPVEVRNLHKRYGKGVWANERHLVCGGRG